MKKNWCAVILIALLLLQIAVMTFWGEHSFVAIHDNLDLFVAHNTLIKNQNIFFEKDAGALMLGGVDRNLLGSEFQLYNLLYYFLTPFQAYTLSYFIKIILGFTGFVLLGKEIYGDVYKEKKELLWLTAAAFSLIPVFPAYGIAFVSIPFLVLILRKVYSRAGWGWWLALFFYPVLSYFSYFGFFILGYMSLYAVILLLKERKLPLKHVLSVIVLSCGYVCIEYRLFMEMLFSDVVTIRESMASLSLSLPEVIKEVFYVMLNPGFHAESSHKYFIFPFTFAVFLWNNFRLIKGNEVKKIFTDHINLTYGFIFLNCIIYGLYDFETFRNLFEELLPVLKGFQFNRTIFLNPFLWYFLFFVCLNRLSLIVKKPVVSGVALAGLFVCMLVPQVYNDFYSNCYHHAYELLKGQPSSQLSFKEFYSAEVFEEIKEEIDYRGEWAVAYGMHPAILQYNGIATLDGYLGIYSQEYKEKFGELIAPALKASEEFNKTFRDSGIRAYIYSGGGENTYEPFKKLSITDYRLYMDGEVFKDMGGKYIFSRIKINNQEELGLELILEKVEDDIPYHMFVYKVV